MKCKCLHERYNFFSISSTEKSKYEKNQNKNSGLHKIKRDILEGSTSGKDLLEVNAYIIMKYM